MLRGARRSATAARSSSSSTAPPRTLAIAEPHLHGVSRNLVDNALRHGAGQPVRCAPAREAGRLRIDVIDQGPGISEANRKRLFERFFTTERDQGGTGLGPRHRQGHRRARGGRVAVQSSARGDHVHRGAVGA